jgi:signal transduction histidine kinase
MNVVRPGGPLPPPPFQGLRARLLAHADALDASGSTDTALALRALVDSWWDEQQQWNGEISRFLSLHHDINNALVGVRGNAQLLMMGPAGREPGVKERLEVVIRESGRIQDAASRLVELRSALAGSAARAA